MKWLPADHVSSFVDVWDTIEETLHARNFLSEMRFGIVSIV